jgi:hypothetical protein
MKPATTISLVVLLLFTIPVDVPEKVRIDYSHDVNFSDYKSFMWINEPSTPKDPLIAQRIVESINTQLAQKGLEHVRDADIAVSVNVASQEKQTLEKFYAGFDNWFWDLGVRPPTVKVETYAEGTIVVDLFDAHTKTVIWRGIAVMEVSDQREKVTHEAEIAIQKLFTDFPPPAL